MQKLERAQDSIGKFETLIGLKDGRIAALEKRRLYEQPFFLLTDPPNNDVTVPISTTSQEATMRVSNEGPVQITQLGAVRDADHGEVLVQLYMKNGSQRSEMSNVPLHIDTIFGRGGKMFPLPEGLYADEDRALSVTFTDLTGAGTKARICGVGAKYTQLQADPSLQRVRERLQYSEFLSVPKFYGINNGKADLTAFQTATYSVQVDPANNFEIHQLSAASTGSFMLNIIDMAKGESILNAPNNGNYAVPAELFVGTGQYPYRFNEPILVAGGQTLLITLIDTSGDLNTIYLTIGGVALKVRKWS